MKTLAGVDLHQRFCYSTTVDASGKKRKQGQVVNEGAAVRSRPGHMNQDHDQRNSGLLQCLHLDGEHGRQSLDDGLPGVSAVG